MSPRYAEPGSTWWPVLWGPLFCAAGAGLELATGPVHAVAWLVAAGVLVAVTALWVSARRGARSVVLTDTELRQGAEALPVARIARLAESAPTGARPLGGGWDVPRKTGEVPLELDDGGVVLAWARDPAALTAALRPLIGPGPTATEPPA